MTKDAFKDCMLTLMAMVPKELPAKAVEIYWDRLSKQGYADEDLRAGSDSLIDNHHWRAFPTVAEFVDACSEARQERLQKDYEARKKEENQYRALDMDQILERGAKRGKSPEVQAAILNARRLLHHEIDMPTWCAGQKIILTDDASQRTLHKVESRLMARRSEH